MDDKAENLWARRNVAYWYYHEAAANVELGDPEAAILRYGDAIAMLSDGEVLGAGIWKWRVEQLLVLAVEWVGPRLVEERLPTQFLVDRRRHALKLGVVGTARTRAGNKDEIANHLDVRVRPPRGSRA